jgi:two-component system CheB/CheR fusion protein
VAVCPVDRRSLPTLESAQAPAAALSNLYLVILEEALDQPGDEAPRQTAPVVGSDAVAPDSAYAVARIAALQDELRAKEEYLHSATEELESSNEELKSSVEEMQSVNEELQSTNEELETAKEELQSVNEELSTVNNELNVKVDDLSQANNDMNNLLAGTGIATVFVDHQLRIMRYTPAASQLINLIPGDVGRPVGHVVSNLVGYNSLVEDTQMVLDTLGPKDVQVQTTGGVWFALRIHPYRTLDNVIEGAVITFTNINELKQVEAALAQANRLARMAVVIHDAFDAIVMSDLEGKVLAWNPAAERMYGWTEAQALQLTLRDRVPAALIEASMTRLKQLSKAQVLGPLETQRLTCSGSVVSVSLIATALMDAKGQVYAISTTERLR